MSSATEAVPVPEVARRFLNMVEKPVKDVLQKRFVNNSFDSMEIAEFKIKSALIEDQLYRIVRNSFESFSYDPIKICANSLLTCAVKIAWIANGQLPATQEDLISYAKTFIWEANKILHVPRLPLRDDYWMEGRNDKVIHETSTKFYQACIQKIGADPETMLGHLDNRHEFIKLV